METQKKIAAFFDLDKTLIDGATLLIVAPLLRKNGLIDLPTLIKAGIGAKVFEHLGATPARVDKVKKIATKIVDGWNRDEMFALMEGALEELFRPKIFLEALELVAQHRELGHEIVVVSSSPIELVAPIAKMFGIDHVIATEIKLDEHGKCTKEFVRWVSGEAKPDAVRAFAELHGIDLELSYGYSDSRTDIGFLETVGFAHAVNPDAKLELHAKANGWKVTAFEKPGKPVDLNETSLVSNPWVQAGAGVGVAGVVTLAGFAISRRVQSAQAR